MRLEKLSADNVEFGRVDLHMTISGMQDALKYAEKLNSLVGNEVDLTAEKHRERRSRNANAMLWACIGELAKALNTDKDSVYYDMLKRYGKYTYICAIPQAVDEIKKQWSTCEDLGDITVNGRSAKQLLCYFGSSTYNTQEFAQLLDGVISEMHEVGLKTPEEKERDKALEQWAKEIKNG